MPTTRSQASVGAKAQQQTTEVPAKRPKQDEGSGGPKLLLLRCAAQNYAWGRPAERSEVAALSSAAGEPVENGKRYAELWMGTHPSGPSYVKDSGETLRDWVEAHPEALGDKVLSRFGKDLPYLLKVLSVETALSIQAHPDKPLAEKLHAERPNVYKDGNHKPEMAVALNDFSALCRFVSPEELKEVVKTVPEIEMVVGREASEAYLSSAPSDAKAALKALYSKVARADEETVNKAVGALVARLEGSSGDLSKKEQLILRLNKDYPLDIGILSVFFLNHMELQPGEAIFLDANEPHAYLSGELMEVMATSDNVVRMGLTPKLKDVEVLLGMLTYNQGPPTVLRGDKVREHTVQYLPPKDEFQLEAMDIPAGAVADIPAVPGPGVVLVQRGAAVSAAGWETKPVNRGDVLFVPAGTAVQVEAGPEGAKLWVANVSSRLWK